MSSSNGLSHQYRACFIHSDGWFENDTAVFISMEYLEHGDLQRYLTRPFPEPEAQHIASQLAEGLAFMHANGFAHRDLKPAVSRRRDKLLRLSM